MNTRLVASEILAEEILRFMLGGTDQSATRGESESAVVTRVCETAYSSSRGL